jgi:GxxExxY protein
MGSLLYEDLSGKALGAAFAVHNALGPGLLESAYQGALRVELEFRGFSVECQKPFPLTYRGVSIGDYFADVVVENTIILELKSVKTFLPVMDAQLINYLRISGLPVGLLVNFHGQRVEWRRFVNDRGRGRSAVSV